MWLASRLISVLALLLLGATPTVQGTATLDPSIMSGFMEVLDADGDLQASLDELITTRSTASGVPQEMQDRIKTTFEKVDVNADGRLDLTEFTNLVAELQTVQGGIWSGE